MQHYTTRWVRDQTKVMEIMDIIKHRKWTWSSHMRCRTDNRRSAALTVWTPMGDKINRGRQRQRWRDELQQYWGNVNWYTRGRDRDLWRQHAKAFVLQWTDRAWRWWYTQTYTIVRKTLLQTNKYKHKHKHTHKHTHKHIHTQPLKSPSPLPLLTPIRQNATNNHQHPKLILPDHHWLSVPRQMSPITADNWIKVDNTPIIDVINDLLPSCERQIIGWSTVSQRASFCEREATLFEHHQVNYL